jgi:hypothetical protein
MTGRRRSFYVGIARLESKGQIENTRETGLESFNLEKLVKNIKIS